MAEEWRDVCGYEGLYQVSNLGRVRSLSRRIRTAYGASKLHVGRVMSPALDRHGYPRIIFRVDGKLDTRSVHRLVCEAFHGPPTVLRKEVDHIDRDRANARADNLRWVSKGQNMARRNMYSGSVGEANGFSKLKEANVRDIRASRGKRTAKYLAEKYGVTGYTIYDIWLGRSWRHVTV